VNPLAYEFMSKALIACTAIAAAAPLVGAFLVQRGQALIGDGIGHMAFAGVGLALLVGVNPLVGALALTAVAAVALVRLARGGLGGDLSLALVFYGGIAVGYVFSSRGGQAAVLGFLFGSPLNLSWGQVGAVLALAGAVLIAVTALYGPLLSLAFDEPAARVSGVPTQGLVLALTVLAALVVVGGMSTVGLLLISALMVVPVAAAARVARSYRGTLVLAAAIGAGSAVAGLLLAFYADLPAGAAIVLVALACYAVAASLSAHVAAAG
jgi:zinc transport system permease protein